jgi:hypothetical protein
MLRLPKEALSTLLRVEELTLAEKYQSEVDVVQKDKVVELNWSQVLVIQAAAGMF